MRDKLILIAVTIATSYMMGWVKNYRETGVTPQAHFWHDIMVGSQKTAETVGRLGIYAENRYREEVRATHGG